MAEIPNNHLGWCEKNPVHKGDKVPTSSGEHRISEPSSWALPTAGSSEPARSTVEMGDISPVKTVVDVLHI